MIQATIGCCLLSLTLTAPMAIAQRISERTIHDASELCRRARILHEVGPILGGGSPQAALRIERKIHGLIVEYSVGTTKRAIGLFSFDPELFDDFPRMLHVPRESVRAVRPCVSFYSYSAAEGTSYLHDRLVDVTEDPATNQVHFSSRVHNSESYVVTLLRADATKKVGAATSSVVRSPPRRNDPGVIPIPRDRPGKTRTATLGPAVDPDEEFGPLARKPLKHYPKPEYRLLPTPVLSDRDIKRGENMGARAAFAIEKVECSEEGNWLTGYFGILGQEHDGERKFVIKQRYGLNNYPGEGAVKLADLKVQKKDRVTCAVGDFSCSAPRESLSYSEFLKSSQKSGGPPAARSVVSIEAIQLTSHPERSGNGPPWNCRPDKNLCISKVIDHWKCDPQTQACASYDPIRWWCVPRREFCFSRVRFHDWGSRYDENDEVLLKASDLVYDMSYEFLTIAQDVLMRRCGSEPAGNWTETWSKWSE